ncbi:hypothetical protein PPYR_02393 [Photinus pyralis]|uniref:Endonuclease/exonuclease/phosphatase domain-containing protein n=1 Tax=Photinus pyralis TaxID=7054 RepID=A0A5N4B7A3_PHOPY|nr:hypothetical protein PPYR_02393 [Photinus pyralis]
MLFLKCKKNVSLNNWVGRKTTLYLATYIKNFFLILFLSLSCSAFPVPISFFSLLSVMDVIQLNFDQNSNPHTTISVETIDDYKHHCNQNINDNFNFQLFHLNIRSISKNLDELQVYLNQLHAPFDCLVLSETWQIPDINLVKLEGYNEIYNQGQINKNDGVYLRNTLNFSYTCVSVHVHRILQISIEILGKTLVLIAMYRPPSTSSELFLIEFNKYLNDIKQKADFYLLVGDFNIDILSDEINVLNYLDIMSEHNYTSTINIPTRKSKITSSCLDHIFIKQPRLLNYESFRTYVLKIGITDHYATIINLKMHEKFVASSKFTDNRKNVFFQVINYKNLKRDLNNDSWLPLDDINDANDCFNRFIHSLSAKIKEHSATVKIPRKKQKRTDWITKGLVKCINNRDVLYKRMKSNVENLDYRHEFVTYRNQLNVLLKVTKANYYKREVNQNKNSNTGLWKVVHSISNSSNKRSGEDKSCITKLKLPNNAIIENEMDLANHMNQYFANAGKNLADKIHLLPTTPPINKYVDNSIFFFPTDEQEVLRLINSFNRKKAPGIDSIQVKTLQEIKHEISKPLTYIFNKVFEQGVFPEKLKSAVIIPLHKKGDKTNPCNYRPISLLSNIGKILEKLIK